MSRVLDRVKQQKRLSGVFCIVWTLVGALFLTAVSLIPVFFTAQMGLPQTIQIGGTGLLIGWCGIRYNETDREPAY